MPRFPGAGLNLILSVGYGAGRWTSLKVQSLDYPYQLTRRSPSREKFLLPVNSHETKAPSVNGLVITRGEPSALGSLSPSSVSMLSITATIQSSRTKHRYGPAL